MDCWDDWDTACAVRHDREWAINRCEERAIRVHYDDPTRRPSRLYKIATMAFKVYTFCNWWEAKDKDSLPQPICQQAERLADIFRFMHRTDSEKSLHDMRALFNRWISIRKLITAHERFAKHFGPHALEAMDQDYNEHLKLSPWDPKRKELEKKFKKMLAVMGKAWQKVLKVAREACHYDPVFKQTPVGQLMNLYVEEGENILYSAHKTPKIPIPGRQNEVSFRACYMILHEL